MKIGPGQKISLIYQKKSVFDLHYITWVDIRTGMLDQAKGLKVQILVSYSSPLDASRSTQENGIPILLTFSSIQRWAVSKTQVAQSHNGL